MRQPCVYIMARRFNGTLYVGVTSDLMARVAQHREGLRQGFTRRHHVKRLVWFDLTETMDAAIAHEKRLKRWRRDWKKNLIERTNPHWEDLAIGLGFPPLP